MSKTEISLSPHCQKVLTLLSKSHKPLTAYEILDKLRKFGIKAPPTVYRALDTLLECGLVHRIETLGAFIACDKHENDHSHAQFAVCRECGEVQEIHDEKLSTSIASLARTLKFSIEREMLELMGLCHKCAPSCLKKA